MWGMLMLAALVALHLPAVSPTEPNRQPQLAAAGGTAALVFGSGETIWLARSLDNGRNFAGPPFPWSPPPWRARSAPHSACLVESHSTPVRQCPKPVH